MTFEEQINSINSMFNGSDCDIEVLPPEESKAKRLMSQNTGSEVSLLAAVIAGTGGVSVNGILRLYGSGTLDFFEKNKQLASMQPASGLGFTAVAEDIFGGIFGLDKDGMMLYFMPDELKIEEFGGDYGEFLDWLCCREDFEQFYRDFCKECPGLLFSEIPVNKGVSLYPPLWENSDEKRSAAAVAMSQLLDVELEIYKKKNEGGKT